MGLLKKLTFFQKIRRRHNYWKRDVFELKNSSCFALTVVLNYTIVEAGSDPPPAYVPKLSVVCVMGYIVGFAIGPGPIPWLWNSEFFPQSARAGGASKLKLRFFPGFSRNF